MNRFNKLILLPVLAAALVACSPSEEQARNVILFLGDAGGISALHAASIYGHDEPQALFIQQMPHIALMDTSTAEHWVSDSAAGMTAIVTGEKTQNGVISQSADAVRGKSDGKELKTILEYAEEHGLSTGVVSTQSMADATPAACYAHSNDRGKTGEIFAQILNPSYGDGVDLVLGAGRSSIYKAMQEQGVDIDAALQAKRFEIFPSPEDVPATAQRTVALTDNGAFDLATVTERAIGILSQNPTGFFLMVECDMHTDNIKKGLEHVLLMDEIVKQAAARLPNDTLIVFTADHSFDIRVRGGKRGTPVLLEDFEQTDAERQPTGSIRMDNGHTGEQVLVAAQGPGSGEVKGYLSNTDLFRIMMDAYGWGVGKQ